MAEEEPASVRRPRGWALGEAVREDLEMLGLSELEERIQTLQAEVARTRAQIERKRAGRAAADSFFVKPD